MKETFYCESCLKKLNPKTMVWLELSMETGLWSDPDIEPLPANESQGGFTFGADCAKRILKDGGEDKKFLQYRGYK